MINGHTTFVNGLSTNVRCKLGSLKKVYFVPQSGLRNCLGRAGLLGVFRQAEKEKRALGRVFQFLKGDPHVHDRSTPARPSRSDRDRGAKRRVSQARVPWSAARAAHPGPDACHPLAYGGRRWLHETAQKRIDEITAELEQLQLEMENEGLEDGAYNALYERVDALEEEARDLQEAYSAEDLARAGVIASWSAGKVTLHVGLVRPEDTVKEEGARDSSANPTGEEAPDAGEISYPASLAEDLKTERAMALGAAMALHPEATLDLTLFKLVSDVLASGMSVTQAIKIDARKEYRSHAKMDEIDETSLEQVAAAHDALDLSWLDDTRAPADQFAAFRALEAGEKAKLVAFATASTTQSCFARDRQRDSLMHDFEIEIMPDIRAHWTPNAALFNRFKKAWLLKILGEDLGLAQEAVTLASSSKKEIVAFCDKLFAEPFATLTDAQRAAVAAWCPPMMQTAGGACDETAPITETPEPDGEFAQAA